MSVVLVGWVVLVDLSGAHTHGIQAMGGGEIRNENGNGNGRGRQ